MSRTTRQRAAFIAVPGKTDDTTKQKQTVPFRTITVLTEH